MQYLRKIKCPRHHLVIPGRQAWQVEPNPFTKDTKMSDTDCKRFGIRKWKFKRDRYGNKIPDFKNHIQPEVSAAFALESVYDEGNPICQKCRLCLEGLSNAHLLPKRIIGNTGMTLKEVVVEMTKGIAK